ncbi:MAG: iron-sulfur cluster assembly protein [Terriglobia bacterium]
MAKEINLRREISRLQSEQERRLSTRLRMVTNEQVYEVLRNCYDPEIPVNLVDLGLIYDVQVDDDHVNVVMTLTARGCPAHSFISEQVRQQVAEIPGVKSANVQVVWDPPWDISRLSEAAKKQLGLS